jgi:HTH-type transcriptional regulator / antitoxin HigA
MELRIIKTDEQYRDALSEVERLAAQDPDPDSAEGGRLELLAKLVEDYEKERFKFRRPGPVEAIMFRMEEQGLRQKDIAEVLGGKNRASEILAGKRSLTLPMIRALHGKLGIPADLLIRDAELEYQTEEIELDKAAEKLVARRGWVPTGDSVSDWIKRLVAPAGSPVLLKNTVTFGATAKTNRTNVWLWLARVREIADSRSYPQGKYSKDSLNADLIKYVARLSWMDKGPRNAKDFLEERGIAVVIEPCLPSTYIDGAAMLGRNGTPVVGLTLRENRMDNFWFTLIHELIHVWKHLDPTKRRAIADENIEKADDSEAIEREANQLASEILIPAAIWRRSAARLKPSAQNIQALAHELQIHPAVVAGRVRYERKNYSLFAGMVGYRQPQMCFPEVRWAQ